MTTPNSSLTRRRFLETSLAAAGAVVLPLDGVSRRSAMALGRTVTPASTAAKYTRYNVMSPGGKKALAAYAKGVEAMLKLPADHPQNWFRNAFIHLMDCPHGNWWFYVWHRGYLGYVEQTIRHLSGEPAFAMPYWDWTTLPQIPEPMFDGVLAPSHKAFEPYTRNLAVFTSSLRPALEKYWNSLGSAQRAQLTTRGYSDFDRLWNDVTGFDPPSQNSISGNIAYANPCGARYLTRDNPKLDAKTTYDVSPFVVHAGLLATSFNAPEGMLSFTSSRTPSHDAQPDGSTSFSVLEGFPHNMAHNCIGGVGPLDPGPYGSMTNFLSPVDPIFFLHHSNMDRLWDVWARKQKNLGLPYLPMGADLDALSNEAFLFYVDGTGQYVGAARAGDYLGTDRFEYDYEPGFGEDVVQPAKALVAAHNVPPVRGTVKGNAAIVSLSADAIRNHLDAAGASSLVAEITLPFPTATSPAREFDVIVGAPADVTWVGADSVYYAGTIAFFGHMAHRQGMSADATFTVPLPRSAQAFSNPARLKSVPVSIRLVPSNGQGQKAPVLRSVVIRTR